jgi:hypothetical protein
LSRELEYGFETFKKYSVTGSFDRGQTALVKQLKKDILATIELGTKLVEERRQQATEMALGGIVGIEVIIGK